MYNNAPRNSDFDSAVEIGLRTFAPETQRSARKSLIRLLEQRRSVTPDWTSSVLTGDGFPLEFCFNTADKRLRYTCEPGNADMTPGERTRCAIFAMDLLSNQRIASDKLDTACRLQDRGSLQYGAWIGGRHGERDRYKIYLEVPNTYGHECVAGNDWPNAPRLSDRSPILRMLALEPDSERSEAYYRVPKLTPEHLPRVLEPAGLEHRTGELRTLLEELRHARIRSKLPGPSVGVSYASAPNTNDRSAGSVTLFFYARSIWGSDSRIRREFLEVLRQSKIDDVAYRELTRPIQSRKTWTTAHGILGLSLTPNAPAVFSIGVRPYGRSQS